MADNISGSLTKLSRDEQELSDRGDFSNIFIKVKKTNIKVFINSDQLLNNCVVSPCLDDSQLFFVTEYVVENEHD